MRGSKEQQALDQVSAIFSPCLQNQMNLTAARGRAADISRKIAAAEEAVSRALAGSPAEDHVKEQSEDLAAAVAMGQATPADAEKRRREIASLEASLAKGLAAAGAARQEKAGLERALANVHAAIEPLEVKGRELAQRALRELAEQVGSEYIRQARGVWSAVLRLAAINELLLQAGGTRKGGFVSHGLQDFYLPAFGLSGFDELTHPAARGRLFSSSGWPIDHHIALAKDEEKARLADLGVEL